MMDTQDSIEKLYAKHKGLIGSLIKSIVVNNKAVVSSADLQQVGALALIVALKTYDPSVGSLSAYVRKCIRNALLEEANSFSGVFTVDEKIRRQANKAHTLKKNGKTDEEIMRTLGIKTHATFLSLLHLVDNKTIELDHIENMASQSLEEEGLLRTLDEVGLSDIERHVVVLLMTHASMEDIERATKMNKSEIAQCKAAIQDKIINWGKS